MSEKMVPQYFKSLKGLFAKGVTICLVIAVLFSSCGTVCSDLWNTIRLYTLFEYHLCLHKCSFSAACDILEGGGEETLKINLNSNYIKLVILPSQAPASADLTLR